MTATPIKNEKQQSGDQIERTVPYNVTSVTLTGADPNINYQITVSYVTYGLNRTEIADPASNPVTLINVVTSTNTPTLSDTNSTSNTGK